MVFVDTNALLAKMIHCANHSIITVNIFVIKSTQMSFEIGNPGLFKSIYLLETHL